MSNILTFKISIPHTNGFFGRECHNPECKRYFKIYQGNLKDDMHCPYCGNLFHKNQLWTKEQLHYAQENAIEESKAHVINELDKIFKDALGKNTSKRHSGMFTLSASYKSAGPYLKQYIQPPHEQAVDTELQCSRCAAMFQILGIFGFCPICRQDNIIIYDTNITILLQEISEAKNKDKALRHAYNDLVATFEDFCKKKNHTEQKYNFQDLNTVHKFFKKVINKDIFDGVQSNELLTIKRLFQKRHAYQHNKGKIDRKYLLIIPEDAAFLNKDAVLSLEEFKEATEVLRKMLLNVI